MTRNVEEAKQALTEKPLLATSAERFLILDNLKSSYKELPQPLRFSKILAILLSQVSVPLEEFDLIAGRCVDRELTEDEETAFQAFLIHPDHPVKNLFWSSGHCTYSWEEVAREGFVGLREKVLARCEVTEDPEKKMFFQALAQSYDALIAYTFRYEQAAREQGMEELANTLHCIATQRPDSFAAVLQLFWIITLVNCAYISPNPTLTVGRLDQILYPFYRADLEKGILTREKAQALITDYYCKHNLIMGRGEHQVGDETNSSTFQRILNFDAPQYLMLGGTDENGDPAENELTELFAKCIVPEFKNPVIVVRYVKNMETRVPQLWKILCEKALRSSSMMFYNDRNVIGAFLRIGLPQEDAQRYAHFGCNWCSPGDNSAWVQSNPTSSRYNTYYSEEEREELKNIRMFSNTEHCWPEDFMEVFSEIARRDPETVSIEDFYQAFFDRMGDFIDRKLARNSLEIVVRKRRPSAVVTFGDCFLADSVENGECFSAGAKYHFGLFSFHMFGTVADCFIAVDQLVMKEKKLSLMELWQATQKNFEGYPHVLALCRNAEKYGMDTPLSNYHVHRLSHEASKLLIEKNRPYLQKQGFFLIPCMQSDTWHLKLGECYGATPDGRLAYTPFSQNSRPSNGVCVGGMTAMFNAMLNLPHDGLVSGALNLDVDPKQFTGDSGKATFSALLATYLNRGGLHAQVTCTDVDDLLDAQKNPHLHRDLRVRITGYSGVFVDVCKKLQDDIIERMK